jgi:hypothetical protein
MPTIRNLANTKLPRINIPPYEIEAENPAHDHANSKGPAIVPSVEVLDEHSPSWIDWPGHWGNSRGIKGAFESPRGPKEHSGWDPDAFAEAAHECESSYEGPDEWGERSARSAVSQVEAPTVESADFEGRHPNIAYELPGLRRNDVGTRLILSVKEKGSDLPPLTKIVKQTEADGEVTLPFKLNPERDVVVLASALDRQGHRSRGFTGF